MDFGTFAILARRKSSSTMIILPGGIGNAGGFSTRSIHVRTHPRAFGGIEKPVNDEKSQATEEIQNPA